MSRSWFVLALNASYWRIQSVTQNSEEQQEQDLDLRRRLFEAFAAGAVEGLRSGLQMPFDL